MLRQHRHHPVGEVYGVSALESLPVEGAVRLDEGADVGDGDDDAKPARIVRIRIGLGEHGVVMILGVRRVDGHQRRFAEVYALVPGRQSGLFRFRDDRRRKLDRHAVIGERDGGIGVPVVDMAFYGAYAGLARAVAAGVFGFHPDEIAGLRAGLVAGVDVEKIARPTGSATPPRRFLR